MRSSNLLIANIACFATSFCLALPATGQDREAAIDACSIFNIARLNAEAWKSGDVLVRMTTSFDNVDKDAKGTPRGAVVETESYFRYLFDYESNAIACLIFSKQKTIDMANKHIGKPHVLDASDYSGISVEKGSSEVLFFGPGGLRRRDRKSFPKDFDEYLRGFGAIELRGYWLSEGAKLSDFRKNIDYYAAGNEFLKVDTSADFVTIFTRAKWSNATRMQQYRFDAKSQMPVAHRMQFDNIDGKKKLVDGPKGKFDWQEINNVYVPKRVAISRRVVTHVNHVEQEGERHIILDLHWFSFNDSNYTNPDLANGSCFESKDRFFSLLDPIKAGADFVKDDQKNSEASDKKPGEKTSK